MKKFISLIIAVAIIFSFATMFFANAEETEVAFTFNGKQSIGLWMNQYDSDGKPLAKTSVAFNTTAGFDALIFQNIWAGKAEKNEAAELKFEIFNFDTDFTTSEAAQPVFSVNKLFDGDQAPVAKKDAEGKTLVDENGNKIYEKPYGVTLEFGKVLPAGQYVLKVTLLSERGDESKPYAVLPTVSGNLSNAYLDYNGGDFGFGLRFTKNDSGKYFAKLGGKEEQLEVIVEEITERDRSGNPVSFLKSMSEFGIVTPVIPENKAMAQFIFSGAPTWSNTEGNSDVGYDVYVWDTDYETSTTNKTPLYSNVIENHQDNQMLTLPLGLSCFAGRQYLIIIYCNNDGDCGYYPTSPDADLGGFTFLADGEEDMVASPAFQIGWATVDESMRPADPTPKPTAAPTAVPTAAPTTAPTAEPTEAPAASGCGSIIAGSALIVLAASMVIIRKKD